MSELIDRGDVLGVISCFFEDSFIEDADVNCIEMEREINMLPTIDAVPVRHGEWIDESLGYHWYGKCSVCGEEYNVDSWYGSFNYCPNCGARMDGKEGQDAKGDDTRP